MKSAASVLALLLTICSVFLAVSCSRDSDRVDDGTLSVFVNIPPQAYMVRRIGGEFVTVDVLIAPGRDPHTFSPQPRQITRLAAADIYFHGIMPFGRELAGRVASWRTGPRVVDITEGVELRRIEEHHHHGEGHGDDAHGHHGHIHEGHHGREGMDPHVWLSPPELRVQARNIANALKAVDSERAELYEENLDRFLADIEDIHRELLQVLEPYRGRAIYVYHPAFGYFARTYGLQQRAVETGGRSPTARQLQDLVDRAVEEDVRIIFVQPQFETRSARVLADAIGGVVVQLDPLAEDVPANLLKIGQEIQKALGEDGR